METEPNEQPQRMNWIARVRQKPLRTKRLYALTISAILTLLIFSVWLISFSSEFGQQPAQAAGADANADSAAPVESPFADFQQSMGTIVSGFQSRVGTLFSEAAAASSSQSSSQDLSLPASQSPNQPTAE